MATQQPSPNRLPEWRYIVGIVGVLAGAVFVNTLPPRHDPQGNLLILVFALSVIWGSLLMASVAGANALARHGVVGLLSGFAIGVWDTKAGLILGLIGAFSGVILGLIVGAIRLAAVRLPPQASEPPKRTEDDRAMNPNTANMDQPQGSSSAAPPSADSPA